MKYEKTKHAGIFQYKTIKGIKYRVRIFYDDTKEYSKSGFKSISEAQAHKSLMESKIITDGTDILAGRTRTFGRHWESYREYKIKNNDWNKNSIESSQYKIRPFLDTFKETPLTDITSKKVQSVIDELYETKDYSQETVESYYRMFKQVMDDAVIDGYLSSNKTIKVTTRKDNWKPTIKTLTLKEYKEFMKLAKDNMRSDIYRCFYLLSFGLRRGEAYGIKQNSIEFLDNGLSIIYITTQRTRNYTDGKSVKTKKSNRLIIVDEVGTQYLRDQIEFARMIKSNLKQILHKDDFIFIGPDGIPYPEKTLNDSINKISDLMAKPVRVTPHMFRHMFTTQAIASGVDSLQLQSVLGHANLNMTEHYNDTSKESAEKVMMATKDMRNID